MQMKRVLSHALAATGLVMMSLALVMVWSAEVSAAAGSNCRPTQVCMYYNTRFRGGWARYAGNGYSYKSNTFNGCGTVFNRCELNDNTASIDNDGMSCNTYHYKNYIGQSNRSVLKVPKGGYTSSMPSGWNDVLSSHVWCSPA